MRTKDFCTAIEEGFRKAYDSDACFTTVPYKTDNGDMGYCLGALLTRTEHFAVVVAHAAHYIIVNPDQLFDDEYQEDNLEDFMNLVAGMRTAPYMNWLCVYFPTLTEEQVHGAAEAGDEPNLILPPIDIRPMESGPTPIESLENEDDEA